MQLSIVLTSLLAAVALAAPAPAPEPNTDAPAVEARQSYCNPCNNGKQTCCSLTACFVYSC